MKAVLRIQGLYLIPGAIQIYPLKCIMLVWLAWIKDLKLYFYFLDLSYQGRNSGIWEDFRVQLSMG